MKQAMFELIDSLPGLVRQAVEPAPHEQRASYVVALDTSFAALAILKARQLLGFPMKLLNLPAQGTHLLSVLCRRLRQVVGHDPFRAVSRHLNPKQLHFEVTWKTLDLDQLATLQLGFAPTQRLNASVGFCSATVVHQTVALERAVENLACSGDLQHHLFGSIPGVHEYRPERQFAVSRHRKHLPHMVQLALAIGIRVEDAVVYHPKLLGGRIDVHAGDQPNASYHALLVAAPLPTHHLDGGSEAVVKHGVIENQACPIVKHKLWLGLLPQQARRKFLPAQVAVDGIMAKALHMVGHVGESVVDLAAQQKLAVVEFADVHASTLPFSPSPVSFA